MRVTVYTCVTGYVFNQIIVNSENKFKIKSSLHVTSTWPCNSLLFGLVPKLTKSTFTCISFAGPNDYSTTKIFLCSACLNC